MMLKRGMNVICVVVVLLCVPFLFTGEGVSSNAIKSFLIFLSIGLGSVVALNYIFFGLITLWHRN